LKTLAQRILFEDNHLLVVNKLAGELVQADKTGDAPLSDGLKTYIKEKYAKPGEVFLGTVHRIDRPTTGVVIYARTSKALSRMNELFREKKISKTYWAIVKDRPAENEAHLVHYLFKNEKNNTSRVVPAGHSGAQKAELIYSVLAASDNYCLLEVKLLTGRHHQIRVQLSNIGCPIKGDLKYGSKRSNEDGSISLHARKAEFVHPVKQEPLVIVAPVPEDPLWQFFEKAAK
jgi:23S rRNA pseudouridine1911/1915/1917 synthase